MALENISRHTSLQAEKNEPKKKYNWNQWKCQPKFFQSVTFGKIVESGKSDFDLKIIDGIADFPLFRTELTDKNVPERILAFRNQIENSDGIIICTPEYVFSIPGGLENIIECCVSTTVFSDKPAGLITASASGKKGHEELQLIMKTVMTKFTPETTLLIQGIKSKVNKNGEIVDKETKNAVQEFVKSFIELIKTPAGNNGRR